MNDAPPPVAQLRSWIDCALELAFPSPESAAGPARAVTPPLCQQCGEPFPALSEVESNFMCGPCQEHPWHFERARSAYRMEGEVREAILGFKYTEQFFRRGQLVAWLTEAFDVYAGAEHWDGLVPVPLYPLRQRDRGFNQARELAVGLAQSRRLRLLDCLTRERETASQTTMRRAERRENMAGAFQLKPTFDLKGLRLLLIDDVFTTGATANACTGVLEKAGAARLAVLTVARTCAGSLI